MTDLCLVMCLGGWDTCFWVRLTLAHPCSPPAHPLLTLLTRAHPKIARAQGGITPGPMEGELDADFHFLGEHDYCLVVY